MQHANVKLSKNELALVTDMQVILTKNLIIEKVYLLFGQLAAEFKRLTAEEKNNLPAEVLLVAPKISKGEQYRHLPYVVLDYPRFYTRQHVFAIRCFFWWGNFFSITLHLGGAFLQKYEADINTWIKTHTGKGWYIGVNTDAWEHHFETDNYIALNEDMDGKTVAAFASQQTGFVKLAKKWPLQQWEGATDFFLEEYKQLLALLKN